VDTVNSELDRWGRWWW